jgi:hypothetical protein
MDWNISQRTAIGGESGDRLHRYQCAGDGAPSWLFIGGSDGQWDSCVTLTNEMVRFLGADHHVSYSGGSSDFIPIGTAATYKILQELPS